ncbi:transmembrane protein 223-domain-containing protein [Paraphysoderma sedebokerense]|nr:transmembrane protein 223-domain-containing protein [Paraphysoderma sedebokerense]
MNILKSTFTHRFCKLRNIHLHKNFSSITRQRRQQNLVRDSDYILYENHRPGLFAFLYLGGAAQLFFWGTMSYFSYTKMVKPDSTESDEKQKESFPVRAGISVLSIAVGSVIVFAVHKYSKHYVSQITLLKGGNDIRIMNSALFQNRPVTISRDKVWTSEEAFTGKGDNQAEKAKSRNVILKVQGSRWGYAVDRSAKFNPNPRVFDSFLYKPMMK